MIEKTEGTIKNGPSRHTGNIRYKTQNEDKPKQSKTHTTQKTKKMSNMDLTHSSIEFDLIQLLGFLPFSNLCL